MKKALIIILLTLSTSVLAEDVNDFLDENSFYSGAAVARMKSALANRVYTYSSETEEEEGKGCFYADSEKSTVRFNSSGDRYTMVSGYKRILRQGKSRNYGRDCEDRGYESQVTVDGRHSYYSVWKRTVTQSNDPDVSFGDQAEVNIKFAANSSIMLMERLGPGGKKKPFRRVH